jgi:NAD(P)-dependent dehydrogenase (short-subunit alcohol dehydrogenase family)
LEGKVIVVTGGNTGLGKETVRAFAANGARLVVLACRTVTKGEETKLELVKENEKLTNIVVLPLDLGDLASIDNFVSEFKKLDVPLHILVNNAGVMATPQQKTTDGFEYQFGINHYGHFKLTLGLLPFLAETSKKENSEGRIVCLSSSAHKVGTGVINFEDLHAQKEGTYGKKKKFNKLGPWYAYGQSKLANIMFACALNRRLQKDKVNVTCNSLHPGGIMTDLQRDVTGPAMLLMTVMNPILFKSVPQGAATSVYVATSPQINGKGGLFFEDCNVSVPLEYSQDEKEQEKLWDISEKETKTSYPKL